MMRFEKVLFSCKERYLLLKSGKTINFYDKLKILTVAYLHRMTDQSVRQVKGFSVHNKTMQMG